MGLLPYLTAHALDEDYEHAALKRRAAEPGPQRRRPIGVVGAVVIAAFAVIVVVAAVQTSRNAGADERERKELVAQIDTRRTNLNADDRRLAALKLETSQMSARLLDRNQSTSGLLARIRALSARNGTTAVRGPGVKVVVDDAPGAGDDARSKVLDVDLQKLANGLWQAGAEAISINGQRLTNLTSIRHAGSAITVNFRSLSRPYTVLAIGNKNTLPTSFASTSSGQAWLDLQQSVHLEFDMTTESTLTLPAAEPVTLRYATQGGGGKK